MRYLVFLVVALAAFPGQVRGVDDELVERLKETGACPKCALAWKDLQDQSLKDADLSAADLRWTKLMGADMSGANLRNAKMSQAFLSAKLLKADIYQDVLTQRPDEAVVGDSFRSAILEGADLTGADLTGATMIRVNFKQAKLHKVIARYGDLRGADLTEAVVTDSDLRNTDLRFVHLTDAQFRTVNLKGADLRWARLIGVVFNDIYGFEDVRWDGACADGATGLPGEVDLPSCQPETEPELRDQDADKPEEGEN